MKHSTIVLIVLNLCILGFTQSNPYVSQIHTHPPFEQIILLESYLKTHQPSLEIYEKKASLEMQLRDYQGAITTMQEALQKNFQSRELLTQLSLCYIYIGEYENAAINLNELAHRYKSDPTIEELLSFVNARLQEYQPNYPNLDELVSQFNENPEKDYYPFAYLYQGKKIISKNKKSYDYSTTAIIYINAEDMLKELQSYTISYQKSKFTPLYFHASVINAQGKETTIPKNNFMLQDDESDNFEEDATIQIPFGEQRKGAILKYSIYFKGKSPHQIGFAETHSLGTQLKVFQKEYEVLVAHDYLHYQTSPEISEPTINHRKNGSIQYNWSFKNLPLYYLKNDNASLFEIAPYIAISSFASWDEAQQILTENLIETNNPENNLEIQNTTTTTTQSNIPQNKKDFIIACYQEIQQDKSLWNNENQTIQGLQQAHTFQKKLEANNIHAYLAFVAPYGNMKIMGEAPNPETCTVAVVQIIDGENIFYADFSLPYVSFNNLQNNLQNQTAVLYNKGAQIITLPYTDTENNQMNENVLVKIDEVGQADLTITQSITGSFVDYVRQEIDETNPNEYFYQMHRASFEALQPEQVQVEGANLPSGPIKVIVESNLNEGSELYLDGKQIFKFSLEEIKNWISLPQQNLYPFRLNFKYIFEKSMHFILPEDYIITEQNFINVEKNNKYINFLFTADKINEREFRASYRLTLHELVIQPEDTASLQAYINGIIQGLSFSVTAEPSTFEASIRFYEKLLTTHKSVAAYKNYIQKLFSQQEYKLAQEIIQRGKKDYPDEAYFLIIASLMAIEDGDYETAERGLKEAIAMNKDAIDLNYYLIELYKRIDNQSALEDTLLALHAKWPDESAFSAELVELYKKQERIDKIINLLQEQINAKPDYSNLHADIGYFYSLLENHKEAEKSLKEALKLDPENSYALNNLAWLYCETNSDLDYALTLARRAVSLENDNFNFFDTLAEVYYLLGSYDLALEAIETALRLSEDNSYLLEQKAKIMNALNNNAALKSKLNENVGE